MVKVSVIVPVYNEEKYLEKCLDSICAQTLKEIEIICVDDGSTDSSLKILENYAEKDRRIKILTQQNKFAGVARNYGLKYAVGKYLSFLDSDDYFEADMLETMYQKAEKESSDIVICRYREYCEKRKTIQNPDWSFIDSFFSQKDNFSGDSLKNAGIFQITRGWAWDKLFKTEFVKEYRYEFSDFRSSNDGYFVYMMLLKAKRISYIDNVFVTYRVNNLDSLSNTREKNWLNGFKMLHLIKDEMKRLDIYKIYQQSFLNEIVYYLAGYLNSMHLFENFKNCYVYMKMVMEPEVGVLRHDREYYFQREYFDYYQKVISLPLDEFLFEKEKKNISLLNEQKTFLDILKNSLEKKGWVFPYHLLEKEKKIILYGAGKIGKCYYSQLINSQFCREVIWVDKRYKEYAALGFPVQSPEIISELDFDYIFIAIKDIESQEEIKRRLQKQKVELEQIRFYGEDEIK